MPRALAGAAVGAQALLGAAKHRVGHVVRGASHARDLGALPEVDGWHFLVRSMFSLTASVEVSVAYHYCVIHFGASLKAVEWSDWLAKFWQFLSGLDGVSATMHLQSEPVGDHGYQWLRTDRASRSWPPVWAFQGGMRFF